MDINKLRISDLSKEDLLWFVKNTAHLKAFLTEEKIAQILGFRKIKEAIRLQKRLKAQQAAIRKARARKLKNKLIIEFNSGVKRCERLCEEIGLLNGRFPQPGKEEKQK